MPSSDVEQIKSRIAIHELIAEYISLEKSGGQFKALCPFHNEKTPSMHISPERGNYYCFGCGAKGDAISFVQEMEGVDFKGALTLLADRLGITLTGVSDKKGNSDEREAYYDLLEKTTKFFEHVLETKPESKEYLHSRGLTDESIQAFRIGYAPLTWHSLYNWLSKKFDGKVIESMGLVKQNQRGYYDRFRGRLMFPIMDAAGRVVAFSGRILPKFDDGEAAKYMNSPETDLYHKSDILYGYDKAKKAIRDTKRVIIVEGQMDLVMSHQAGVSETVALSGTALTQNHITRLKYLAKEVVLALDSDSAGIRAAQKSGIVAFQNGLDVSVVVLPSQKDPADIIKEDEKLWKHAVEKRKPIIEHFTNLAKAKAETPETLRALVDAMVLPLIASMDNAIQRDQAVAHVAHTLGVSTDAVVEEVRKKKAPEHSAYVAPEAPEQPTPEIDKNDRIITQLVGIYVWQQDSDKKEVNVENIVSDVERITKKSFAELMQGQEHMAYEAEERYGDADDSLEDIVKELVISLEENLLKKRLLHISKEIQICEQEKTDTAPLLTEYKNITERINHLHTQLKNN